LFPRRLEDEAKSSRTHHCIYSFARCIVFPLEEVKTDDDEDAEDCTDDISAAEFVPPKNIYHHRQQQQQQSTSVTVSASTELSPQPSLDFPVCTATSRTTSHFRSTGDSDVVTVNPLPVAASAHAHGDATSHETASTCCRWPISAHGDVCSDKAGVEIIEGLESGDNWQQQASNAVEAAVTDDDDHRSTQHMSPETYSSAAAAAARKG